MPLIGQQPPVEAAYEFLTPELQARFGEVKAAMAANGRLLKELEEQARRYGGQFVLGPEQMCLIGLKAIADMLWSSDTEEGQSTRLEYDMHVQELLARQLEGAKEQMAKAALAAGAHLPPDQLAALTGQGQPVPSGLTRSVERRRRR